MRYFDSYRIFHGKNSLKEYGALTAANMAVLAAAGALVLVSESGALNGLAEGAVPFICGFITGLVPFVCGVMVMAVGFGLVCGVSNGNLPSNPGYRFFHSLAGGAGHYRRALLFSNMLSLVSTALYAAVGGALFQHYIIVVMTSAAVFMMGFLNLTSHMRSPWIRIIGFCVIGFIYGFYGGVSGKREDGLPILPADVTVIVCAVIAAFYIISVIVSQARAETLWSREG